MNEIERQKRNGRFVADNVYICQSILVDKLLEEGVFNYEDIINFDKTNNELLDEGYTQEEINNSEIDIINQEVYEWWVVSHWMLEKLKNLGEPVLENDYGEWWGRTIMGQAIKLDHVINKMFDD